VTFAVPADAYDRFMGRYSTQLAAQMADLAGIEAGQRVLDVGCGPGALTTELVARVGAESVSAVDPSQQFVEAARERHPGVDVRRSAAEELPFPDATFDAAIAQLVVHFMADPGRGLAEMVRVTRPGGAVAACVWDHAGEQTPLAIFWRAARELFPGVEGETDMTGSREGQLGELFTRAGLREVEETALPVRVEHASFEEWWDPFTLGVGPAGSFYAEQDEEGRRLLRERCRELFTPPFTMSARAWAARGRA